MFFFIMFLYLTLEQINSYVSIQEMQPLWLMKMTYSWMHCLLLMSFESTAHYTKITPGFSGFSQIIFIKEGRNFKFLLSSAVRCAPRAADLKVAYQSSWLLLASQHKMPQG